MPASVLRELTRHVQSHLKNHLHQPLNRQRRFVLLAGAAAILTACGSRQNAQQNRSSAPSATTTKTEKVIRHAMGETTVPATPARVVVWGYAMVEAVVALGVQPVGIPGIILNEASHFELDKGAITNIGESAEPNLETLSALNPDLILTTKSLGSGSYTLLSQIAPTVAFDVDERADWRSLAQLCAEALDKQSEVEKLSADYDAKIAQLKSQLSQPPEDIETSIVIFPLDEIRALGEASFPGSILSDVGLSRPSSQMGRKDIRNISLEALDQVDGDVIFLLKPQGDTALSDRLSDEFERIQASPLWQQLSAAQSNQIYSVDYYWLFGSYIAADLVLDDLMKYLT